MLISMGVKSDIATSDEEATNMIRKRNELHSSEPMYDLLILDVEL